MPKVTVRSVKLRIHQLSKLNWTLNRISDRLHEDFEHDLVPDVSTISRIIKRLPPDELKEDVPFSWATMSEVPWEHSRIVLNIWAYYLSLKMGQNYGPFTRRLAKWSWRVVRAVREQRRGGVAQEEGVQQDIISALLLDGVINEPTREDVLFVALEYTWREIASTVMDEPFDTHDLDMWLAFAPWRDRAYMELYVIVKYDQNFDESNQGVPIRWHLLDIEWLHKVAPIVAEKRRAISSDLIRREPLRPRSDIDQMFYEHWQRLTEGLLGSQINLYRKHLGQDPDIAKLFRDGVPRPWYFDYLDEVVRDPATYGKDNTGDEG